MTTLVEDLVADLIYLQRLLKDIKLTPTICQMTTNKVGKEICSSEKGAYGIIERTIECLSRYPDQMTTACINSVRDFVLLCEFLMDNITLFQGKGGTYQQYQELLSLLSEKIAGCQEQATLLLRQKFRQFKKLSEQLKYTIGEIDDFCLRQRLKASHK